MTGKYDAKRAEENLRLYMRKLSSLDRENEKSFKRYQTKRTELLKRIGESHEEMQRYGKNAEKEGKTEF